jgi:MSHA biogenesis protein MshO
MRRHPRSRGFTLVELVVAVAISSIVVVFASMFMAAPIDAYDAQNRRNVMMADASAAWPRMHQDLLQSLPNSLRVRRNGNFVVLEMLTIAGYARYMATPNDNFRVAGTTLGVFGTTLAPSSLNNVHLSVNNLGNAGTANDAYTMTGSMTPAITLDLIATPTPGEATLDLSTPGAFIADSPRHKIYLVNGPVTYLCDEGQGTLHRFSGYPVTVNQVARDSPGEFAGATAVLVARGITNCNFSVSPPGGNSAQTAAVRLTATRNNETLTLLHSSRAEYLP